MLIYGVALLLLLTVVFAEWRSYMNLPLMRGGQQ